jgi:hypothetical protein
MVAKDTHEVLQNNGQVRIKTERFSHAMDTNTKKKNRILDISTGSE